MACTPEPGSRRVSGKSGAAPQKQVGTERGSLARGGERGVRSLPSAPGPPRSAGRVGAGWGRRGGRGDYRGATRDTHGPKAAGGPHARPQTMTTGVLRRSNKKAPVRLSPPPPARPAACGARSRPRRRAPAPLRASARLPAAGRTLRLLPASAQNLHPAHAKWPRPRRGEGASRKAGRADRGGARALSLFFYFPQSPVRTLGSSPPPRGAGCSPRPAAAPFVYAFEGVTKGDVLFSPETQREGETGTGRNENKHLRTRGWDRPLNLGIPRRPGRREVSAPVPRAPAREPRWVWSEETPTVPRKCAPRDGARLRSAGEEGGEHRRLAPGGPGPGNASVCSARGTPPGCEGPLGAGQTPAGRSAAGAAPSAPRPRLAGARTPGCPLNSFPVA